jgi:hypothetical protein
LAFWFRSAAGRFCASFESISAVASSADCMEVRTEAARLKSIAAPTKPMIGSAASASMGATPPLRSLRKRLSSIGRVP